MRFFKKLRVVAGMAAVIGGLIGDSARGAPPLGNAEPSRAPGVSYF